MSIISVLKRGATQQEASPSASATAAPRGFADDIDGQDEYIDNIKKNIDSSRIDLTGNPIALPPCPFATTKAGNDARQRSGNNLLEASDLARLALWHTCIERQCCEQRGS